MGIYSFNKQFSDTFFLFQALFILAPGNTTVNTRGKNPCLYLIHILDEEVEQERKEWKKKDRKKEKKNREAYNMSNSISYSYAIEKTKLDSKLIGTYCTAQETVLNTL